MIAIIGGSGFVGTPLMSRLTKHGIPARIIDKSPSKFFPDDVTVADVRDYPALVEALSGVDCIVNLAAEHRDDVTPKSLYDEVNVDGARNVCKAAEALGITKLVFTSSVAVYGFAPLGTDECGDTKPFNDYGRTKLEAEAVYRAWAGADNGRTLVIVRPTVIFGERNRGNVYNLLRQMATGPFLMIGRGTNRKSMAYVENVAAALEYFLDFGPGVHTYNYVDKPDFTMNDLIAEIDRHLGRGKRRRAHWPVALAYPAGLAFDFLARITNKRFTVSAIRIKKFVSDTMFAAKKIRDSGFEPPVSLSEGLERTVRYEFLEHHPDDTLFYTE